MVQVYKGWDSAGAAERTARRWLRLQPRSVSPLFDLAEAISRQGRWNEVDAILRTVDSVKPGRDWRELQMYHLSRREDYPTLARVALEAIRGPGQDLRNDAIWHWVIGLRNQGRLRDARRLIEGRFPDGGSFNPPALDFLMVPLATIQFDSQHYDSAAATYHRIVELNWHNPYPGHRARGVSWNLTLESSAVASLGDTARVRVLADSVERVGRRSLFARSPLLHHYLRGLLLAREGRHAEAVDAFRRAVISWSDGFTRINYAMAKSYLALGRPRDAIEVLRPALRGAIDASNLYLTRTEIHELLAQAFVAAGQKDSASVHYGAVVRAWDKADPQFAARYRAAKGWLAGK
jgi:tetratricopeptide (TPR) repeat protein